MRRLALPLILILLATLLRLYHLDFRALWWDEGLSLFFARLDYQTSAQMAVTLADTNPPVYRLLLGAWLGLVGWSAFAARLFSALPGVVLVALVYRLARELRFRRYPALAAMAICAGSPMLIYYAQEAKGYSLVAAAATASVLIWLRCHAVPGLSGRGDAGRVRPAAWLAWGSMLLLAVGSHYIAVFLIAVQNAWTLVLTIWRWRGNGRYWLRHWSWQAGMQLAAALALLPFVGYTFGGTRAVIANETGEFTGLDGPGPFFGQHALELSQGPTAHGPGAWLTAAALMAMAVWGGRRLDARSWGLATWAAVPLLLGFGLNLFHQFFFPRFVLYSVPPLLLLVVTGAWQIAAGLRGSRPSPSAAHDGRWPMLGLVLATFALWSPTLRGHYAASADPAEDWRPVADAMRPLVREGDAAIYVWGWMPGYLDAYLPPAPRPSFALGFFTPESLDPELTFITSGRARLWLLDYKIDQFDVRNQAGRWLGERAALVYDQWFGNAHVALFALEPSPGLTGQTITAEFDNGLRLTAPQIRAELDPGGALAVRLEWEATRPIGDRATVFLHGLAADGSLAFGRDSEPRNGLSPVAGWTAGAVVAELRGVLIPADLPPGIYTLQVGMYDTATGAVDGRGPVAIGLAIVR